MKLSDKVLRLVRTPRLTPLRIGLALTTAVVADGLQWLLLPLAWTFVDSFIDVVAMALTVLIIGFHPLLLPTFVVEFIPVVDIVPTWTGCVALVIALRKRAQNKAAEARTVVDVPPLEQSPPRISPPPPNQGT